MPNITIQVDHAALRRILDGLKDLDSAELKRLIADAVAQDGIIKRAKYYPGQSGKPQTFTSSAQRRAFFAKLRRGEIQVPYRRTYGLMNSWAQTGDGMTVSNTQPYADLVMGSKGKQSKYHAGNWLSVDKVAADTEAQDARPLAEGAITLFLVKRGLS
jgi:hypothetical protein